MSVGIILVIEKTQDIITLKFNDIKRTPTIGPTNSISKNSYKFVRQSMSERELTCRYIEEHVDYGKSSMK